MVYQQKTLPTQIDPFDHIMTLELSKNKQIDSLRLLKIFSEETGLEPVMWGNSIIGFGVYEYESSSGIKGVWPMTGFSIQKAKFSLYLKFDQEISNQFLSKIGRHKSGVSCVYVNKLADIDEDVLRDFIKAGFLYMQERFVTFEHL